MGTGRLLYGIPHEGMAVTFTVMLARMAGHGLLRAPVTKPQRLVSVHVRWTERARGTVGVTDLALMKPSAMLVNTSRGPIVDEDALLDVLTTYSISGAALDVFDIEPPPAQHPLRRLQNVIVTPHIGFVTDTQYRLFYGEAAASIDAWLSAATG